MFFQSILLGRTKKFVCSNLQFIFEIVLKRQQSQKHSYQEPSMRPYTNPPSADLNVLQNKWWIITEYVIWAGFGVVVKVVLPSAVLQGLMKIRSDDGIGVSSCFRSFLLTALNRPPFTGKIMYIAEIKSKHIYS